MPHEQTSSRAHILRRAQKSWLRESTVEFAISLQSNIVQKLGHFSKHSQTLNPQSMACHTEKKRDDL